MRRRLLLLAAGLTTIMLGVAGSATADVSCPTYPCAPRLRIQVAFDPTYGGQIASGGSITAPGSDNALLVVPIIVGPIPPSPIIPHTGAVYLDVQQTKNGVSVSGLVYASAVYAAVPIPYTEIAVPSTSDTAVVDIPLPALPGGPSTAGGGLLSKIPGV